MGQQSSQILCGATLRLRSHWEQYRRKFHPLCQRFHGALPTVHEYPEGTIFVCCSRIRRLPVEDRGQCYKILGCSEWVLDLLWAHYGGASYGLFVIWRAKGFHVGYLYQPRGIYWYRNGVNLRAMAAFAVGLVPQLPGLAYGINPQIGGVSRGYVNFTSLSWIDSIVFAR